MNDDRIRHSGRVLRRLRIPKLGNRIGLLRNSRDTVILARITPGHAAD
jgi:hypothetical protein